MKTEMRKENFGEKKISSTPPESTLEQAAEEYANNITLDTIEHLAIRTGFLGCAHSDWHKGEMVRFAEWAYESREAMEIWEEPLNGIGNNEKKEIFQKLIQKFMEENNK